jgi:membrane-associated phospholipid phosphatase
MGAGVAFLSYLTAMADWPLRDRELLALDRALGFDWRPAMHAVDQWPLLVGLLGLAYQTHTAQIACVVLFLALRNRPKDLDAFLLAFLIAGALTTTISALVPALGPASLFGDQNFINLKLTGATPADVLAQLRAGSARIIDLDHMAGIVTFPSFHTAIALLVVHAMRRDGWLLMPAVGLNALMLASTITEGGHYVIDVLAGGAVTLVAATVAGALAGSQATRAPLRPALPNPA